MIRISDEGLGKEGRGPDMCWRRAPVESDSDLSPAFKETQTKHV